MIKTEDMREIHRIPFSKQGTEMMDAQAEAGVWCKSRGLTLVGPNSPPPKLACVVVKDNEVIIYRKN